MDSIVEQMRVIPVDRDMRELAEIGTPDFPLSMYDNTFSRFLIGKVPWHWHEAVELGYVFEGGMRLHCGERSVVIGAGEGMFINANALHSMTDVDPRKSCHMVSVLFSPSLIAGLPNGVCQQKFIEPLISSKTLPCIPLRADVPWQAEAMRAIRVAFAAYRAQTFGFELTVVEALMSVWRCVVTENRDTLQIAGTRVSDDHIKQMLVYMQRHYAERLTLSEIAASAHISERACTRCFRDKMRTTPFAYLHSLRIRVAAEQLRHSDRTVGEIADAVGFMDNSYFSKVFRAALGCSPREYRARHAQADAIETD